MQLTDDEWQQRLPPEQYHVLRERGTEAPGTGKYVHYDEAGMYRCAACGQALFSSAAKYESALPGLIGWPAFSEAAAKDAVELRADDTLGMHRTEVVCKHCGGHLGHLFEDPSSPNGQHFCINSAALDFKKEDS